MGRAAFLAAYIALALAAALATAAGPVSDNAGTVDSALNSEARPLPKRDPSLWTAVAGARFGEGGALASDMVPFTVDFFTVAFRNQLDGLAAGAQCKDAITTFAAATLDSCQRVPVLYRFSELAGHPGTGRWVQVDLPGGAGGDAGHPASNGYIGGIAYLPDGRVLAVGGDGKYPSREEQPAPGDAAALDVAGHARAWLYANGRWCEYGPDSECGSLPLAADAAPGVEPKPMTGLSSVACSPRAASCFAGGYQQLWSWKDGAFGKSFTHDSATCSNNTGTIHLTPQNSNCGIEDNSVEASTPGGNAFRFRVRAIRYVPGSNRPDPEVIAVTAGCCATNPAQNVAQILTYNGARWTVRPLADDPSVSSSRRQTVPDSYFAMTVRPVASSDEVSVLATPGGPAPPQAPDATDSAGAVAEPASRIYTATADYATVSLNSVFSATQVATGENEYDDLTGDIGHEIIDPSLASVRLVGGDGDVAGRPPVDPRPYARDKARAGGPDGVMDWAVGSWTGVGAQYGEGVAYTTTRRAAMAPSPLTCPGDAASLPLVEPISSEHPGDPIGTSYQPTDCKVDDAASTRQRAESQSLFALGTYALNAFAAVQGGGWAVGDRGALVRLGSSGTTKTDSEPVPPALGIPAQSPPTGIDAFDAFRPALAAGSSGTLPALATRPVDEVAQPRFVAAGSPENSRPVAEPPEEVSTIIMNVDGSEGWALGGKAYSPSRHGTTLVHYLDGRWTRCDMSGIRGVLAADPACASLQGLRDYTNASGQAQPVEIYAAARVPHERDSDPTTADDFEVVAFGARFTTPDDQVTRRLALRYVKGRWHVDESAMHDLNINAASSAEVDSLAFTSPDDGWLVTTPDDVYRFVDGHWKPCKQGSGATATSHARCDDPTNALVRPTAGGDVHVTSVGDRVYLYGARPMPIDANANGQAGIVFNASGAACVGNFPEIIYHDPGKHWTGSVDGSNGGWDPAGPGTTAADQGQTKNRGWVTGLAVTRDPSSGAVVGWATGRFGEQCDGGAGATNAPDAGLLRLQGDRWVPWAQADASDDYLRRPWLGDSGLFPTRPFIVPPAGTANASQDWLVVPDSGDDVPQGPALAYHPQLGNGQWTTMPTPFSLVRGDGTEYREGVVRAIAADGADGSWWAVRRTISVSQVRAQPATYFYHYTRHVPRPVFKDVPLPIDSQQGEAEQITGVAGSAYGRIWLSTSSGTVYRYDRATGWDRLLVSGWDAGRLVTRTSEAWAIATNADGVGVLVGRGGRIADVSPDHVVLDPASGLTGRELRAAAVAPDGSALVGGDHGVLLYRPAGGSFGRVGSPPGLLDTARITGITMPSATRAWLVADSGQLFAGTLEGAGWSWRTEGETADGTSLTLDYDGDISALRSVAIDADGRGFAVGDRGVILARDGHSWSRMREGYLDNLTTVTLSPAGASHGAVVGGDLGLVLTLQDGRFEVARPADVFDPLATEHPNAAFSRIVGTAVMPGYKPGQVEVWAAQQTPPQNTTRGPALGALLHYASDDSEPLLQPTGRALPLPDAPDDQPGAINLAAFGKSDCVETRIACPELTGTSLADQVWLTRTRDEIAQRADGLTMAIYTGDVSNVAGSGPARAGQAQWSAVASPVDNSALPSRLRRPDYVHRRFDEVVARPLGSLVPFFAALGGRDLSDASACLPQEGCVGTRTATAGVSLGWRNSFSNAPAPWGSGNAPEEHQGFTYVPVDDQSSTSVSAPDPLGGARTHYAIDVERDGKPVVRVVFVDTSLRTLTASDADQNPVEGGGQLEWLQRMLCIKGSATDTSARSCSRPETEQAVLVSNTPTYSYGPPAAGDTEMDGTQLEAILLQNKVNAVIAGRLGWNGLYYVTSPGLHSPCPGAAYPDRVPESQTPCDAPTSGASTDSATSAPSRVSRVLQGLGAPMPPVDPTGFAAGANVSGVVPVVVASGAGGRFGPDGTGAGKASDGYWHGFSVLHLDAKGDPRGMFVEQRPVLDWINIEGATHRLLPGQRLTLHGYGREPIGSDQPIRYDDISSPAVTHRYDLLAADPERPWLPKVDPALKDDPAHPHGYVELDPDVARIDPQTGTITAGRTRHGRIYAIALLSVGSHAATYPLVFEPRRSYTPPPTPGVSVPVVPRIRVLGQFSASIETPTPPAPTTPPPPIGVNLSLPTPPTLPSFPANTPSPVTPPAPPAPPAPPSSQQAIASNPSIAPVGVSVPPTTGVTAQPTPPVNPSPPTGARREAKQRQAATAKSEEGGGEQGGAGESLGRTSLNDSPGSSPGSASTRLERHPFTAIARSSQASAWSRNALLGGGIGVAGLALALMWTFAGPRSRRRIGPMAAPAWNPTTRDRR